MSLLGSDVYLRYIYSRAILFNLLFTSARAKARFVLYGAPITESLPLNLYDRHTLLRVYVLFLSFSFMR